jgi:hypothetical protein
MVSGKDVGHIDRREAQTCCWGCSARALGKLATEVALGPAPPPKVSLWLRLWPSNWMTRSWPSPVTDVPAGKVMTVAL